MTRNIKLTLSYDGTDFFVWQLHPNRRPIHETLESAIVSLTGESRIHANASGRTDTGVHAVAQVVNFRTESQHSADVIQRAVNAHLPNDVLITSAEEVDLEFDANRDAVRKLYRYVLHDGDVPDLFLRRYSHHTHYSLDVEAMREGASALVGKHDFRCFETEWPNRATSVRTITRLTISRFGDWIWVDVEADGFLYNMVRAIVGTLINVGRGYWPTSQVAKIVEEGDRRLAGPTAPALGLFLMRVTYDSP